MDAAPNATVDSASPRTGLFMAFSLFDAPPREHQIEVGTFDQLPALDAELLHEVTRLTNPLLGRFVAHQHDFELEKMAETFDAVKVNAGASNQEESSVFADASDLSVGQRKRFTKYPG